MKQKHKGSEMRIGVFNSKFTKLTCSLYRSENKQPLVKESGFWVKPRSIFSHGA